MHLLPPAGASPRKAVFNGLAPCTRDRPHIDGSREAADPLRLLRREVYKCSRMGGWVNVEYSPRGDDFNIWEGKADVDEP